MPPKPLSDAVLQTSPSLQPLPPFKGFPKEGMSFLKQLKKNNTREWFQPRKPDYERLLKFPMQCFIAALGEKMRLVAPEYVFNPHRSVFRIYRDVRFSADKSPYKTNIAAAFAPAGNKQPDELPSFYLHIEPEEVYLGGGIYMPSPDQLKRFRAAIVREPESFLEVVEDRKFKKRFGALQGEKLVTAPKGFAKNHPMLAHLQHKQFYVGTSNTPELCLTAKFVGEAVKVFTEMMPLMQWLREK